MQSELPQTDDALVEVRDLRKHFPVRRGVLSRVAGYVKAVDGVSFAVRRGRTLGLVGESGCGKTTAGRSLLRLLEPTGGEVWFDELPVHRLGRRGLRALRRRMQMVFQDPYSSLNPRMTVEAIVGEPLTVHGVARGRRRRMMVGELLERVGLSAAYVNHYPHEFSGGQRQRIGIARALALDPDFIVCDEPVSALDVSIQAQIINLLADLQRDRGLSYLFISHDLGVVEHISHDVAVMYMGKIVETAPREAIYREPLHPYTRLLLAAIPSPDPETVGRRRRLQEPTAAAPPPERGCPFLPRCGMAGDECRSCELELRQVREGHWVRCIRAEPGAGQASGERQD
jgi:oligopeptide transport system ATP-binding protein